MSKALGQQAWRRVRPGGQALVWPVIHLIFDLEGNRIAEYLYDASTGTSTLLREYIWMDGVPVAVVENGVVYYVRTDHIGRPVFATDATGAKVWEATYLPFGEVLATTGNPINLRFPGQWFQSESGLHQNWMRDYDPTTGRYMQADPLGLVDGASVYGYARQNPGRYTDPTGLSTNLPGSGASSSSPIQCEAEDCVDLQEKEVQNCRNRFDAHIIADLYACYDRAEKRKSQCYQGIPESERVPEWGPADEDVPGWGDSPILPLLRLFRGPGIYIPPNLLRPFRPGWPGIGQAASVRR